MSKRQINKKKIQNQSQNKPKLYEQSYQFPQIDEQADEYTPRSLQKQPFQKQQNPEYEQEMNTKSTFQLAFQKVYTKICHKESLMIILIAILILLVLFGLIFSQKIRQINQNISQSELIIKSIKQNDNKIRQSFQQLNSFQLSYQTKVKSQQATAIKAQKQNLQQLLKQYQLLKKHEEHFIAHQKQLNKKQAEFKKTQEQFTKRSKQIFNEYQQKSKLLDKISKQALILVQKSQNAISLNEQAQNVNQNDKTNKTNEIDKTHKVEVKSPSIDKKISNNESTIKREYIIQQMEEQKQQQKNDKQKAQKLIKQENDENISIQKKKQKTSQQNKSQKTAEETKLQNLVQQDQQKAKIINNKQKTQTIQRQQILQSQKQEESKSLQQKQSMKLVQNIEEQINKKPQNAENLIELSQKIIDQEVKAQKQSYRKAQKEKITQKDLNLQNQFQNVQIDFNIEGSFEIRQKFRANTPQVSEIIDRYEFNVSIDQIIARSDIQKNYPTEKSFWYNINKQKYTRAIKLMEVVHNINYYGEFILDNAKFYSSPEQKYKALSLILRQQKQYFQYKYSISAYINDQISFCVCVISQNNAQNRLYLRNLDSIFQQQYQNYHVVYVDDASTDQTGEFVEKYMIENDIPQQRYTIVRNSQRKGSTQNSYILAHNYCQQGEVMAFVDGDDALIGRQVFSVLNAVYQKQKVGLVYSQNLKVQDNIVNGGYSRFISSKILDNGSYRKLRLFSTNHLKTLYVDIFRKINVTDLQLQNGNFFDYPSDATFMTPAVQMVGKRLTALPQIFYENRLDSGVHLGQRQTPAQQIIASKNPYTKLTEMPFADDPKKITYS